MRILAVCGLGLGVLVGGCVTQQGATIEPVAPAGPAFVTVAAAEPAVLVPLAAIKRTLLAARERIWKESDSVRGAMIGEPYWCPRGVNAPARTCICIEANARNSYGGFTGVEKSGFKFANATEFETLGTMGPYATCGKMTPFPEMNGGKGPPNRRS